ncbi:MAG TPA: type II secretion system protein, partial [Acidimicrobiales bacterium]|nr:type II secretion system protein [Acidimicrobiales bacterium]
MRTIGSPLSRWARRRSAHGEEGFTLLEMVVTMAILAVVVALTSGLIIGFSQQTADVNDSIQGVQEAREAAVSFIGYLRGATGLLAMTPSTATSPVSPSTSTSATTLTMTVATGFNSSTMSSNSTVVCAQWQPPVGNQDAKFEVSFNCG